MALYRDHGIVLRTYKLGEADRIVVLITEGHGKVRAVAKGVRKTKSRVRRPARADQPRRRSSSTRAASSTSSPRPRRIDHFRADPRRPRPARPGPPRMLEAVDQRRPGARAEPRALPMLLGALRTLAAQRPPARRARRSSEAAGPRGLPARSTRCAAVRRRGPTSSPSTSTRAACSAASTAGARRCRPRRVELLQLDPRRPARRGARPAAVAGHPRGRGTSPPAPLEHHLERRLAVVSPPRHDVTPTLGAPAPRIAST